jgi:hypothetical protein
MEFEMKNLWVEIEVLDFNLETIGFDFNVLNSDTKKTVSKSYIRMSLDELRVFVDALKASTATIDLTAPKNVADKSKYVRSARMSNDNRFPGQDLMKQEIAEEVSKIAKS